MKNFRDFLCERNYSERERERVNYLNESNFKRGKDFDIKAMKNSNAFKKASQILSKLKIKLDYFYLINSGSYDFYDSIVCLEFNDYNGDSYDCVLYQGVKEPTLIDDDYGLRINLDINRGIFSGSEIKSEVEELSKRIKVYDEFVKLNRLLKEKDYYIYQDPEYI